jgi:hypothetical protein
VIAVAVSLLVRLFAGGLFLSEIASQTLFSLTPGQIESRAVETLGPLAKYSALIGAVVANTILYGLIVYYHSVVVDCIAGYDQRDILEMQYSLPY